MRSFDEKIRDYAELVVVHGLNVQKGQIVHVTGEVPHRELLLAISEASYEHGASFVQVEIVDTRFSRQRIDCSSNENLGYVPPYVTNKYDYLIDQEVANVRVVGPEFPLVMDGADPAKVNIVRKSGYEARKRFYEEGINQSKVHWNVVAGATPQWAHRIYPEFSIEDAYIALWEDLFAFCRVGAGDHLEKWRRHDLELHARAKHLTNLRMKELHFQSEGTDLHIGLSEHAKFQGGTSISSRGAAFEPNLPTEECFTTPDWRRCSGKVQATRPFFVNGVLIRGLSMTIQSGEITDFSAESGGSTFEAYINSDPGARRLGEVALVSVDSPIFKAGRVYEEILLDENAACHIAIGSAYRFCLELPNESTEEQWNAVGCNSSSVHTDIMVSDEHTSVDAILDDGSCFQVIREGRWAFEID